jgi:hypothetical protein
MIRFCSWSSRNPRNRDWAFSWRGRIETTTSSTACRYIKGREKERDSHRCTFESGGGVVGGKEEGWGRGSREIIIQMKLF